MISILMYHHIGEVQDQEDPDGLTVLPRMFEQQMAYLHRGGYRCIGLSEAVSYFERGLRLPRKSFVLTFDDGYQDLSYHAWPILKRFGFTATIFLVAGRVGLRNDWAKGRSLYGAPLLSWVEVLGLAQEGINFGCHTLTHPRLTQLNDERVTREIQQSKVEMENHMSKKVDCFAYPYGVSDARIRRIVSENGYKAACGVDRGAWGIYNLWRSECMRYDSMLSFALKARGWHEELTWLREESRAGPPLRQIVRAFRGMLRRPQDKARVSGHGVN